MQEAVGVQPGESGSPRLKQAAVVLTLLATVLGLGLPSATARFVGINLAGIGVALISAWACARRSKGHPESRAESRAWFFFSLAMLGQALGHAALLVSETGAGNPETFQTVGDSFFLAVLALLLAALVSWPHDHRTPGRRFRTMLDAFLFGGSLLFIFWQLGLRDLAYAYPDANVVFLIIPFVFVSLDLGYWVYLVLPLATFPKGPLGYMGLGLGAACLVNLATMLASLSGTYGAGHWADALALPVLLVPALGAWSQASTPLAEPLDEVSQCPEGLQLTLPFLPAMLGLGIVLFQLLFARHRLDWQTIGIAAWVVAGLFFRQYLSLQDLARLSKSLESRVQERTRELSHAQDLMVRTERMNAMATLGAGLAHDMKNLIGVVRNYALLVHRDLQEGKAAEMEDLEAIQLASGQAVDLANQLMNYGHSDDEHHEAFDLTLRLTQLGAMLSAILPADIEFSLKLPGEAMTLRENPFHIDQMVVNLVLNARDAMPHGGRILLTAQPETTEKGRIARLIVEDTGSGISDDVKSHLFEPFFTTKPPGQGTGIGLASVKAALRGFGGRIQVESQPGVGTKFILLLPLT